jgi:hypothetical protein
MGRNSLDNPRCWASLREPGGHKVHQREQVFDAKAGASLADAQVGIGGNNIGPSHRHRAESTIRMLEGDPLFAPQLLGDDEPERVTPERMEGMNNPNLLLIRPTRCSRQL